MRKSIYIVVASLSISLSACTETKKIAELQDQIRRQESQILKERQENAEISSFRFSLESQYKKKAEDYIKCQEDSKETFESLSLKYNRLLDDYTKLQTSYKSLNESYETNKENTSSVIMELEERTRQGKAAISKNRSSKSKVKAKSRSKKRRR
jgi:hypothetical protein